MLRKAIKDPAALLPLVKHKATRKGRAVISLLGKDRTAVMAVLKKPHIAV